MHIYELIFYFFIYGFLGWCTEVAFASVKESRFVNRGFLNGPICPIYGVGVGAVVALLKPWEDHLVILYLASVILVTVIEGVTGYAMDKIFHHKWWDYSERPFNIGGYVCLLFSLVWGVACVVILKGIHPFAEMLVALIPRTAGMVILVILLGVLIADICVTSRGVLKLNRRLETMEKIAAELREISDKMGSNIHENVMEAVEKIERLEDMTEERKEHYAELRKRYAELSGASTRVSVRLLKAFPKMESRKHRDILAELRRALEERLKK